MGSFSEEEMMEQGLGGKRTSSKDVWKMQYEKLLFHEHPKISICKYISDEIIYIDFH